MMYVCMYDVCNASVPFDGLLLRGGWNRDGEIFTLNGTGATISRINFSRWWVRPCARAGCFFSAFEPRPEPRWQARACRLSSSLPKLSNSN